MKSFPRPTENPLRIQTPCPKRWDELSGSGAKRFCSECRLHVHDASRMTEAEAQELVANATSRVCMRMELDESGAPVFRDASLEGETPALVRFTRWALTASAGLLAACQGESAPTPHGAQNPAPDTTRMGQVAKPMLGEVATPTPLEALGGVRPELPAPREKLGDVALPARPDIDPR